MGSKTKADIGLNLVVVSDSITRPANTTAYTAKDAVSDATDDAHFSFSRALKDGGHDGEIVAARITTDQNSVATALDGELWLFHTDITAVADNGDWTVTDAELLTRVGVIEFPTADWRLLTAGATCDVYPNIPFKLGSDGAGGGKILYGQLIARNAYTPSSGEVFTVELVIAQY